MGSLSSYDQVLYDKMKRTEILVRSNDMESPVPGVRCFRCGRESIVPHLQKANADPCCIWCDWETILRGHERLVQCVRKMRQNVTMGWFS